MPLRTPASSGKRLNFSSTAAEKKKLSKSDEVLEVLIKRLNRPEDSYDMMAKVWAGTIRDLDKTQSLYAKKLINDVIFQAEQGNLNAQSTVYSPPTNRIVLAPLSTQNTNLSFLPSYPVSQNHDQMVGQSQFQQTASFIPDQNMSMHSSNSFLQPQSQGQLFQSLVSNTQNN